MKSIDVKSSVSYSLGMRVCHYCKREEGDDHSPRCPYYWGFIAGGQPLEVDEESAMLEHRDGCPLSALSSEHVDCDGCIECIRPEDI